MRQIFLPELISIELQNFTLYPKGLSYKYDFINGANLILGGNGMGKTTFVNIIKYAIIGHYKKPFDYTRTYKDRIIEKRILYPIDYFKNRMDSQIVLENKAKVIIKFKINQNLFIVERDLENIILSSLSINNQQINGGLIPQLKYESLSEEAKINYLQYKYEISIEKYSGLSFDDLIFFVNEILFFGEDHKTILWNDGITGSDVQNELFNKYFNSPELDKQRQESQRQAKYFDSLSRHRSEDIRAIRKVLDKVTKGQTGQEDSINEILKIKKEIDGIESKIDKVQKFRVDNDIKISLVQNKLNELSIEANELETKKNRTESKLVSKVWETLHPQYDTFTKNIKSNHICPICNKPNEVLLKTVLDNPNCCFACGTKLEEISNKELNNEYNIIVSQYKTIHQEIQFNQREIRRIDDESRNFDIEFRALEVKKRQLQAKLRTLEFSKSKNNENSDLQAFYDEISKLDKEKEIYQEKSKQEIAKAEEFSKEIENQITQNASKFSTWFSSFAESFLGVKCSLTFDDLTGQGRRFYPVIDGRIRLYEEELSESQRFFIDHSFRMSILSFFYTTPTFYIVETPDSSLDISYEKNAAAVFLQFLQQPNSLIITSNLNNNTFINYIVDNNDGIMVSMVGLLDIAKQSIIQNTSNILLDIYNEIKNKIINNS